MATFPQPSVVPDGLVYDVLTVAGDLILSGDIATIVRTFGVQEVGQVQAALKQHGACEASANLWDKRDRKAGYPREDPITLIIRRQITKIDEVGTIPRSIMAWFPEA